MHSFRALPPPLPSSANLVAMSWVRRGQSVWRHKGFVTSCWERGGMIICYFPSREKFFLWAGNRGLFWLGVFVLCVDGDGGDWCWLFDVKFLINADCRLQRLVREGWTVRRREEGILRPGSKEWREVGMGWQLSSSHPFNIWLYLNSKSEISIAMLPILCF